MSGAALRFFAVVGLTLAIGSTAPAGTDSAGRVAFVKIANSRFDRYTRDPSAATRAWMRAKYWRVLAYGPYFDSRLSWFPDAWLYKDLYAIYPDSKLASEHPEWILRDGTGTKLYIPYECSGGRCTQYAGDVGDPGFRASWIAAAKAAVGAGYRGLFVDDVNLLLSRVSDGTGKAVVPIDRRTREPMTEEAWRRYMADFCVEIRAAFPTTEIVHNVLWWVGHDDPSAARELESATLINLERGVNDSGLRGGRGTYGFERFLAEIDWLHARGKAVILEANAASDAEREYGLAAYFLVGDGHDGLGNDPGGTPDDWWPEYEVALGPPRGTRYVWHDLLRRDFEEGFVLVNQPGAKPQTVALDAPYEDARGRPRASVTLGAAAGAVLVRPRHATSGS